MSIKRFFTVKKEKLSMRYNDPLLFDSISNKVISWLPESPREYVIVCVGTDRSTGDSLGPLVGTFLSNLKPKHMTIYGTLQNPVHAKNLSVYINKIERTHKNPCIIAIDACLGRSNSIGHIIANPGPLAPGAALSKPLPPIGDIHITGVVNLGGFMEFSVLQNTRLSIVFDMANNIAQILNKIDQQLTYSQSLSAVVSTKIRQSTT